MIPTLKYAHKARFKKQLLELKSNPELLKEYYDQRQLEQMTNVVKTLSDISKDMNLNSLSSALMDAYAKLDDYMSMSKLQRAATLGTGLKSIEKLTKGVIAIFSKQLRPILDITLGKLGANWNSQETLSTILADPERITKFSNHVKKALKPGFLGISDLPFLNVDEFVSEILEATPADLAATIKEFDRQFGRSTQQNKTGAKPFAGAAAKAPSKTVAASAPTPSAAVAPTSAGTPSGPMKVGPKEFGQHFNDAFNATLKSVAVDAAEAEKIKSDLLKNLWLKLKAAGHV